ncbi:MAG: NAD(P)H-dependent oxidoreductase subunit E, partial [Clostridia bacterium]
MVSKEVLICGGTGCLSAGAEDVEDEFLRLLEERGISSEFPLERMVKKTGCIGPCSMGPTVLIMPDEVLYVGVAVDDVKRIIEGHLVAGEPVRDLMISDDHAPVESFPEQSFFRRQTRIALRNTGLIDPLNLDDYLARDGYQSLKKALREMTPEEVIDEVKTAGLRGRGGAGFPTGLKWQLTREAEGEHKFVVCNADEGDPGAFMDRSILEGDPHSIIEAMTIAGYAIGADTGYVYVRAEYPLAINNLKYALVDARERGFLGDDIMDSGFSFEVSIRVGAGAFVCGEETALIASIEGKRGYPRSKPPFPATDGLWGYPTVINNVETLAN